MIVCILQGRGGLLNFFGSHKGKRRVRPKIVIVAWVPPLSNRRLRPCSASFLTDDIFRIFLENFRLVDENGHVIVLYVFVSKILIALSFSGISD